jgi:thiol-disulfide isomerase/thioredoxin
MKNPFAILLSVLILLSCCTSKSDKALKSFTLRGEIIGQDTGNLVLTYWVVKTWAHDTAKIKNGRFIFRGKIVEPKLAIISGRQDSDRVFIYIEPVKMKISLTKGQFEDCKMTGSKTQNESEVLNKLEESISKRLLIIREQVHNINDSIKNEKDSTVKLSLERKAAELNSLWEQTRAERDPIELKYLLENPKSFVILDYLPSLESRDVISLDSLKSIFNRLDNSLRKSDRGKQIIEDIRKKENVRISSQAPDFKLTGLNNQAVTLSQFKGNSVVLLDFWASWCAPCRKSIPHLKTIYNKYHSKGLIVIAVSLDEDRKSWIDAVKQDSTEIWYHIPIAEKWPKGPWTNDDIDQNYYYRAIPELFLIDKNGKIIYRLVGYSKENEESLDSLLSQIFNN